MQYGIRGTSGRCGGGFAEQVAGNVDKGEAPTLFRDRLEIRLDENFEGFLARINLDTNGRVAKVDFMASSVLSSNNGVGHRLAQKGIRQRHETPRFESRLGRVEGWLIGIQAPK
jgi:hypothetical protein